MSVSVIASILVNYDSRKERALGEEGVAELEEERKQQEEKRKEEKKRISSRHL